MKRNHNQQNNKPSDLSVRFLNFVIIFQKTQMNIEDFKGLTYFRFLVPSVYIFTWITIFIGPFYTPTAYQTFVMFLTIYVTLRITFQTYQYITAVIRGNQTMKRAKINSLKPYQQFSEQGKLYHAFILASYKESTKLLSQTLEVLASHKRAKHTYLIFLAMEDYEPQCDKKAEKLISMFKGKFFHMDFTRHKLRQYEVKSKSANVTWCAQQMQEKFKKLDINGDDVLLTTLDADSHAPAAYIDEVEDHISKNFEKRHTLIYHPTQIFTRNSLSVPMLSRTYDDMYAGWHVSNLVTMNGFGFAYTNVTVSYKLMKRIGFWDTNYETITEDIHLAFKAHFKTQGETRCISIFIPFNNVNVQTGKGYFQDLSAKFWQIERHTRGTYEIGYCILMFLRNKFSFRSLYLAMIISQPILIQIVMIPWVLTSKMVCDEILKLEVPEGLLSANDFFLLSSYINILLLLQQFLNEYFKRQSSKVYHNIECPSLIHLLQIPLCVLVNFLIILPSSYLVGSFRGIKTDREWFLTRSDDQDKLQASNDKMQLQSSSTITNSSDDIDLSESTNGNKMEGIQRKQKKHSL